MQYARPDIDLYRGRQLTAVAAYFCLGNKKRAAGACQQILEEQDFSRHRASA